MTLDADQRRALALLAKCGPRGVPQSLLIDAHGFALHVLIDLRVAGLASTIVQRLRAGGTTIEVARLVITDAGRRTLAHHGCHGSS